VSEGLDRLSAMIQLYATVRMLAWLLVQMQTWIVCLFSLKYYACMR